MAYCMRYHGPCVPAVPPRAENQLPHVTGRNCTSIEIPGRTCGPAISGLESLLVHVLRVTSCFVVYGGETYRRFTPRRHTLSTLGYSLVHES